MRVDAGTCCCAASGVGSEQDCHRRDQHRRCGSGKVSICKTVVRIPLTHGRWWCYRWAALLNGRLVAAVLANFESNNECSLAMRLSISSMTSIIPLSNSRRCFGFWHSLRLCVSTLNRSAKDWNRCSVSLMTAYIPRDSQTLHRAFTVI